MNHSGNDRNSPDCAIDAYSKIIVKDILEESGIAYDLIHLANLNIKGCLGCLNCAGDNRCVQKDDFQGVVDKITNADALVFGGGNYYGTLNAIGHAFWERTFALRHRESFAFAGKLGIAVGLDRDRKNVGINFISKNIANSGNRYYFSGRSSVRDPEADKHTYIFIKRNKMGMHKINGIMILIFLSRLCLFSQESDLNIPEMTDQAPAAGLRVKETAPEYIGTEVHHSLYLPADWEPGKKYPVLVEYTGNYYPESGSTGMVGDANLGYGLTGGNGFIWVVMPCIAEDLSKNERTWWGNREATINYCKLNLPRICQNYGGDSNHIFICGFSRGAIAVNYIGLADDEIARFWKGFIAHEHYDGVKTWGYEDDDRASALARLKRLKGRPQLICEAASFNLSGKARDYLAGYSDLGDFTFLTVPVDSLFNIPEEIPMSHTDLWPMKDSQARRLARHWLWEKLKVTNLTFR